MSEQIPVSNSRYPRPQWFRLLRSFALRWWIVPIAIIMLYVLFIPSTIFIQGGDPIRIFLGSIKNLLVSVPLLLLLVLSISAGILTRRWAEKDEARENDYYKQQEKLREEAKQQREEARKQSREREKQPPPAGFKLRCTLKRHTDTVNGVTWSPDGRKLASGSYDKTIIVWNVQTGRENQALIGHSGAVNSVAWSPDGKKLASGSDDSTVKVWDVQTAGEELYTLSAHTRPVISIAWSPDGKQLASYSVDRTVGLWDAQTGQDLSTLSRNVAWSSTELDNWLRNVVGSPDGKYLASDFADGNIRIWDHYTGNQSRVLEGHTDEVSGISFSFDSRLLISKSNDETVRLWRTDTWETVAILNETNSSDSLLKSSLFSPTAPVLATLGEENTVIRIWDLDFDAILNSSSTTISNSYTNAKVVLLGDSGVGKSGLGLVLSGEPFTVTASTHARRVWTFEQKVAELSEKSKETRETLLWDLAGQPGYRLIHQLYLNEVAVALVVFDARNETDPFAGVEHWNRALLQAQRIQGDAAPPLKKFLVAARVDRGGIGVSEERIQAVVKEFGFDGYFATSAKEGWQVSELKEAIGKAIDWDKMLPKVSSTELFQQIKSFLVEEKKQARHLISTIEDLYRTFVRSEGAPPETKELPAQFETCIGRVEASGLIKRLSFGRLVLLQPEMPDAYASALVNVVKDEPDGLGHIAEERVRKGDFRMSADERIGDKQQEELLLLAMVEDLLRRELALREESYLVFPSQSTKENPDLPNPEGKTVVFDFEGPVLNIYATLAVRLANSGVFKKKSLWKNAIIYTANGGGECGMFLHNIGEGRGDLTLFYPHRPGRDICNVFEEFVHLHLKRRALPDNFKVRRVIVCYSCNTVVADNVVQRRKERGIDWLNCPVCDTRVSLVEPDEPLMGTPSPGVQKMDQMADTQRDIQVNKTSVEGKKEVQDFDVFLCHHGIDKSAVKTIGEQLQERGLLPWLDEWELQPGLPWQTLLEEQIGKIKSAAVFVGKSGMGPWQQQELNAFLREFVNRGCPVIPVLLEDSPTEPKLPIFLQGMTWVDFRKTEPDPMDRLEWGITGKRKGR